MLTVGLVQIVEPMLEHLCFPYALGLLESYARAHLSEQRLAQWQFLPYVFERKTPQQRLADVQMLAQAQVVGFSVYTWNEQYSLALAQHLRQMAPEVMIVFGGPQIPDHAEDYLNAHPFIDLCCHGPGEKVFAALLDQFKGTAKAFKQHCIDTAVEGLSLRDTQGCYHQGELPERTKDLEEIPSPYLSGCFDSLMAHHPHIRWIGLWETNRGCPFSCAFCDWGSLTRSKVYRFGMERLLAEIDWFGQHQIETIYCCDANFGIFPRDIDLAQAIVDSQQRYDYPRLVYTQTTKNATDRAFQAQQILSAAKLSPVATLSLQSVNPQALSAIQRENISQSGYRALQIAYREANMQAYTDLLVGLPGETLSSFMRGIGQVIEEGQHHELRLWNVFLLPNAPMNAPAYRQKHGIVSIRIPYVNYFSEVEQTPDPHEIQEMLVATHQMTQEEWSIMRHFGWLVQVLYYSRLLQAPIMLAKHLTEHSYSDVLQAFLTLEFKGSHNLQAPLIKGLNHFFRQHTQEILAGAPTALPGTDSHYPKAVWMPADYFAITQLTESGQLQTFIKECHQLLLLYIQHNLPQQQRLESWVTYQKPLSDAFAYSLALFKGYPNPLALEAAAVDYPETARWYQQILRGETFQLS